MEINLKYEVLTPSGFSGFRGVSSKIASIIFHVMLSNGSVLKCTEAHELKFLNGEFLEVSQITIGDVLFGNLEVVSIDYCEEYLEVFDLIDVEKGSEYFTNDVVSHNCAFIDNAEALFTSAQQTLATGGKCIALSTPNGMGNWFEETYKKAMNKGNSFLPLCLPWSVHPERTQEWRDQQDKDLGLRNAAQECDGDFTTSGATVILPEILKYYEENTLSEPIERQGLDRALWVWEYPDPMKFYAVVADVARGDGADYSAFHIIDTETLTQVAEYQAQVDTREYANILLSEAARYNNALLVIENANIGWDVIQSVIERGYTNMYYSHKVDNNADFEAYMAQYNRGDGLVPGFSTTQKSRPLIIERMRDFLENKLVTIRSIRLLEELRSFIWKNGKSQAMQGRNDDLVMAFAIAMYLRESSLRFKKTAENLTYASLNSMTRTGEGRPIYNTERNTKSNPWNMEITAGGNQQNFDISWLIG